MHPKIISEPFFIDDFISIENIHWTKAGDGEQSTPWKLRILRDCHRWIHSQKSRILAQSDQHFAHELNASQKHLDTLRQRVFPDGSLSDIVNGRSINKLKLAKRKLPPQIKKWRLTDRFERPDRKWEREIVAAAMKQKWILGYIEKPIPIQDVESFHVKMEQTLKDLGAFLFVENGSNDTAVSQELWVGHWFLVTPNKDLRSVLGSPFKSFS